MSTSLTSPSANATLTTYELIQREAYLAELATLGQLRTQHARDPLVKLLIEAAVMHTEANLRVVELADNARDRIAASRATASEEAVAKRPAARKQTA